MTDRVRAAFDAHYRDLVRFAYLLGAAGDEAEDHVANAFLKGWHKISIGRVAAPDRYLRRIVANSVKDAKRRDLRRRAYQERWRSPYAAEDIHAHSGFEDLLGELSHEQRKVLICRFVYDMDVYETADELGIAVGTVKSRTARAIEVIRVGELQGERSD